MRFSRYCTTGLLAATLITLISSPARAQDTPPSLEEMWEVIQEQQAEIDSLKRENAELGDRVTAPSESPTVPQASAAAREDEAGDGAVRPSLEVYGFAQVDAIYDFNRVDPDWNDSTRPSKIPVANPDQFGEDGEALISVRQSRLGFRSVMPTSMGPLKTWFEWDLYGAGNDAGDRDLNLRHFWGELGAFGGGQTWTNWMDIDIFPNTIDYWGPPGMIFIRKPQIRYTHMLNERGSLFSIAIEDPDNDVDPGEIRDIDAELAETFQSKEPLFDLTARYRGEHDWGHWQLGGIVRRLEAESTDTVVNRSFNDWGWGLNLTGVLGTFGRDKLKAGVVYAEGIAAYFNDGGSSLAPGSGDAEAVESLGITLYYDHYWNDNWSSSVGWGMHEQDNTNGQQADAFKRGQLAQANLLWSKEEFLTGFEVIWAQRDNNNGDDNSDFRVQYTLKYSFGHQFFN